MRCQTEEVSGKLQEGSDFGDTSKFGPAMRSERGYEPGKNWDEPMYNVFRKDADGTVRHFWGSEMLYAPEESGQHHRAGRSRRSGLGPPGHGPGGARRLRPEAGLLEPMPKPVLTGRPAATSLNVMALGSGLCTAS